MAARPPAREPDAITVIGAREHNLSIDRLDIPKRRLVVFTGPSGSGKSSLAFDTLYAEGQRRYVETLSAYARQFLGQMERPNVEHLKGLSPTIAIEQKSAGQNPRSTVGTITEVYDYLRVLYARAGEQRCPVCGKKVESQSPAQIAKTVLSAPEGTTLTVLAPLVEQRKGEFKEIFDGLKERGFARVSLDGKVQRLDALPAVDKKKKHDIFLVVDRITVKATERARITESVEVALREGAGDLVTEDANGHKVRYSEKRSCHGIAFPELAPASFSFNGPLGMCPSCNGLGSRLTVDEALVVPDPNLSIRDGAIVPWGNAAERESGWTFRVIDALSKAAKVDVDAPFAKLSAEKRKIVLYGMGDRVRVAWGSKTSKSRGEWDMKWDGVIPNIERRYQATASDSARELYKKYMREAPCADCGGKRLRKESLAVFVGGKNIDDVTAMTVQDAHAHMEGLKLGKAQKMIAEGALREIQARLGFLLAVRLDYLTLARSGPTLSGGEAQRIRLASQLGSELSGVMYVLDEPSIGLHQRDNGHLIATLRHLADLGNSVLVVEHDEETIRAADWVADFGPGAGEKGGKVVAFGTPAEIENNPNSLTGQYLSGKRRIDTPTTRRKPRGHLVIRGATEHNLKNVTAKIPVGVLTAITGVSGAGKSSLINRILLPSLSATLHGSLQPIGAHKGIDGIEAFDKVIAIDQQPIGRTPRSNPATYTKAFDLVRELFANLPEARARGFEAGRFSFNVKGGRCEACQGDGVVKVEMHFLADVYVPCEECGKKRYNEQTLAIRYRDKSIADVLETSIDECFAMFASHPALKRILGTLVEVGLGYMKLGQPATTLSGGEAQRVKLSRELGKTNTGKTLYVLDEPTTGLHFADIEKLLHMLQKLVDSGSTVVVIEHNLDVIKCADHVIDLGPEGGDGGGRIIAEGTPEEVARNPASHTGAYLAKMLAARSTPAPKAKGRRS